MKAVITMGLAFLVGISLVWSCGSSPKPNKGLEWHRKAFSDHRGELERIRNNLLTSFSEVGLRSFSDRLVSLSSEGTLSQDPKSEIAASAAVRALVDSYKERLRYLGIARKDMQVFLNFRIQDSPNQLRSLYIGTSRRPFWSRRAVEGFWWKEGGIDWTSRITTDGCRKVFALGDDWYYVSDRLYWKQNPRAEVLAGTPCSPDGN